MGFVGSVVQLGPTATLDGPSCQLLSRYLATLVQPLAAAGRLDPLRPALEAIDECAAAQREHDRRAFDAGVAEGFVSVAEAAELAGVSTRAIRARLARGTLAGERRGKGWRVDAAELAARRA
jgi:excisionase family DNA binding protein